ncbi:HotDog domain-containing protein [Aspergillus egyptiacus]|nr:HotDog domain-containing protein [Aspergillus egyptiacus]
MDLDRIKQKCWTSSISYDAGNIITYNLSIGADGKDLRRCWEEHQDFHALPTFTSLAVINIMGKVTRDFPGLFPLFQPGKHPHVHAEHYLEAKGRLPTSGTLVSEARILDVVDRRSGVAVVVGITTRESGSGTEVCYNEWTSFLIKMPGDGASRASLSSRGNTPRPSRKCDATVQHRTTPEQGALYRAATGEWNPMHIDPETAVRAGFPGPILSGTCTIGMGVKHVIETFAAGDTSRFKSVRLRLSKPVFPGEVIETQMWNEEGKTIVYQQVAPDGRVVISQAEVRLRETASRSQL